MRSVESNAMNSHGGQLTQIQFGANTRDVGWSADVARKLFTHLSDIKEAQEAKNGMRMSFAVVHLDRASFVPVYSDYTSVFRALVSLGSLLRGFFLYLACGYEKHTQMITEKIEHLICASEVRIPERVLLSSINRLREYIERLEAEKRDLIERNSALIVELDQLRPELNRLKVSPQTQPEGTLMTSSLSSSAQPGQEHADAYASAGARQYIDRLEKELKALVDTVQNIQQKKETMAASYQKRVQTYQAQFRALRSQHEVLQERARDLSSIEGELREKHGRMLSLFRERLARNEM